MGVHPQRGLVQVVTVFSGCSSNGGSLTVAEKVPVCSFRCVGFVNRAGCQQQAPGSGHNSLGTAAGPGEEMDRAGTVCPVSCCASTSVIHSMIPSANSGAQSMMSCLLWA